MTGRRKAPQVRAIDNAPPRAAGAAKRGRLSLAGGVCIALSLAWAGSAWATVDGIEFICPCELELRPATGEASVTFGVRNFRPTVTGALSVAFSVEHASGATTEFPGRELIVGPLAPDTESRRFTHRWPELSRFVEADASDPALAHGLLHLDETEADGGSRSVDRIPLLRQESGVSEDAIVFRSPDFLTDGDGDGVADANERLEGTDPADPESAPGESTLDVLVLHNEGYASKFGYAPHTRIHHLMTLASLAYEDSGTNIRLRTVGIVSMEDQDGDWDDAEDWNTEPTVELLERVGRLHGADINVYFRGFPPEDSNFGPGGGFANLGGHRSRGYMTPPARARFDAAIFYPVSAFVVAHEIGHVLGLDHPMQWGTVAGTFRWARGHTGQNALTTIMGNGGVVRFSDPDADCSASGCPYGAPRHEWNGADAVASLDAVRFQVARFREEKPDADGDNIVDPADRFPLDAAEWRDTDGDGIGNRADPDDDNDAVPDGDDRFPLDPMEWADIDDDGIGDNADPELPSEEVLIPDPVLRAIIEDELGLPPGTPIAAGDMASIDDIQMPWNGLPSGERVRSLEGLQHAGSLHTLTLRHGDVSDLSPLSGLERLGWLDLSFNLISDVSPLVGMPSLRSVVLGGNAIADISPLAGMNQLGWLELHLNYLDDASLEWLGGLTGLHRLNLSNQQGAITDIAPLADLRRLEHLELSDNPRLYDIGTISHFPELRTLYLNYMPVSDISALAGLTRLSRLHLSGTRVKNLDELTGLPELSVLFFWQNSVSDMAMFSKLRSLSVLHINYNQISDISALVDSPVLADDAGLWIQGNPLGREAIYSHVPLLEARGITVHLYDDDIAPAERHVPDGRLRAALAEAAGKPGNADDVVLFDNDFRYYIRWLDLSDLGIEDLTGLEHAHRLESVNLARNPIEDLSPLLGLASLRHVTLDAATLNGASFQRDIDALRARGVAVTSAETGQGMATADECRPGLLLAPGEDCVYPGTEERFAVDAGGTAAFLFGTFGESVEIVGRIGGTDYDLAASRRDGGVWRIDRVAGRTGAPADDSGTDASSDGGADAPGDFDLDDDNVSATGITFANGRFHVVDSGDEGDDKVYAYTASGQRDAAADFDLDAGNVDAGGIVFVNGRFHVTDRGDDKVYAYTASGQRDAAADFDLADYNNDPSGIAFANGRFYVTDWHNDKVYVYTGGEWPTTFEAGETLADLPTGDWTPDATSGGSFSTSGGAVTVQLDNGGYIEEGDYRYTCRGGGGCRIEDRRVTSGSIVRTSAGDGAPPSFVAACFASEIWYRDGAAIDPLTLPPAAGGDAPLTYSLEVMRAPEGFWELEPRPALIPGLAFDPATRRVEGAPINDTDWIQSYGLRYAVTDADGDTDELEFQIYLLPANSTYRTHGAMYDDSCDGFLTDAFTDSTGRTIRFRLQFGADWDLGRPRGVALDFHGNETG
ncbi:MAG: hypothetical protein F4181_07070, partial [Proteobacteria bacterium]|nr:hypothetical protein [Pseudomonadota bacterium]